MEVPQYKKNQKLVDSIIFFSDWRRSEASSSLQIEWDLGCAPRNFEMEDNKDIVEDDKDEKGSLSNRMKKNVGGKLAGSSLGKKALKSTLPDEVTTLIEVWTSSLILISLN